MKDRRAAGEAIPPADELIAVGIIRKAHGVRGEASVESLTESLDRFSTLERVWLVSPDRDTVLPSNIRSSRVHAGRALLAFDGIDSPERLRDFQNWTVEVAAADARPLDDDEYFIHDLLGLRVVQHEVELGVISDALEAPGGLLLTVRRADGGTFDLPFADALIVSVDIEEGVMEVDLPEGLTDLDAIVSVEEEASSRAAAAPAPAAKSET